MAEFNQLNSAYHLTRFIKKFVHSKARRLPLLRDACHTHAPVFVVVVVVVLLTLASYLTI